MIEVPEGLAGVVIGETCISNVDGEAGQLSYRGYSIDKLSTQPLLRVAWLLIFGEKPSQTEEEALGQFLLKHRELNRAEQLMLQAIPTTTHPMLMLQGMVPLLDLTPQCAIDLPYGGEDAIQGLIIAAKIPTLIASFRRLERGESAVSHSDDPNFHRYFLQALHGQTPTPEQLSTLDAAQILQMEHSFNAGTFAGRVTLSTAAPISSSISASLGTLYGRLHGGADQAALEAATMVGTPDAAANYVRETLAAGGKIMGMGHREYRVVDPRAKILKPMARLVCTTEESARLLATLEAIEAACIDQLERPDRPIRANVEFYKGAVFHALGIPSHYFTAMFAMARTFGYIAHCVEFRPISKLIRPAAAYAGNKAKAA
ncbi:MAG: citrate synthase [Halieaceae bacterium]|jgi:citrate synthase